MLDERLGKILYKCLPGGWGDAQHSRALATFLEDQGLGPGTYAGQLRTACNSSCRGSCCLLASAGTFLHVMHINSHRHTHAFESQSVNHLKANQSINQFLPCSFLLPSRGRGKGKRMFLRCCRDWIMRAHLHSVPRCHTSTPVCCETAFLGNISSRHY